MGWRREAEDAAILMNDPRDRLANRVQLTIDGITRISTPSRTDIGYAQLVKL